MLQSEDLGKVYREMHLKSLYNETVMIMDTCQAMSLYDAVDSPGLTLIGSSSRNESAYSHQYDVDINTSLNDKFTFYFYEFLAGTFEKKFTETTRLSHLPRLFPRSMLDSNVELKVTT